MRLGLYEARLLVSAVIGRTTVLPERLAPHVATINLTENCQSRCRMCDYWRASKPAPISRERAESLLEELRDVGITTLRLLGGEPLLRKDLFSILDHAATLGFERVVLATNGLLLDRFAADVNQSCVTNLTVSVDGLASTHDAIRGIDGYFDRVLRNLALVRGKRIKLAVLISKYLVRDVHGLIEICRRMGYVLDVNPPSFDLPYASSAEAHNFIQDLWPSEEDTDAILGAIVDAGFLTRSLAEGCRRYLVDREYPLDHCLHGFLSLLIRANGDVTLGCYDKKSLGNVLRSPLPAILRASSSRSEAGSMFRLECERCVCGWAVSHVFAHPLPNLAYARGRLDPRPPKNARGGQVRLPVLAPRTRNA